MNIKSRIAKLEQFNSKGHEVIVPSVEFVGCFNPENCTHAIASWGDGKSHRAQRSKDEDFSEFRRRFAEEYMVEIQKQLSDAGSKAIVLEHDADLI